MGEIQLVEKIDRNVKINTAFVTVTDKTGLINNKRKDGSVIESLPENGIIGTLFELNPDAVVISTGGTAKLMREGGYKIMDVSEYTGMPEMGTGLVKSMHGKLYAGMLAHPHTPEDAQYVKEMGARWIDMVLVNFYPLEKAIAENPLDVYPRAVEIIRQNMDVGGPTSAHTSRKGFLSTALATRVADYAMFIEDMKRTGGHIGLESRLIGAQHASTDIAEYMKSAALFMNGITVKDLERCYTIIEGDSQ